MLATQRTPRSRQRGVSMVVTMMVSVGVTGMVLTAAHLATTNLHIAHRVASRQKALFVAEAGLERAQMMIGAIAASDWSYFLGGANRSSTLLAPVLPVSGFPAEQRPTTSSPNLRGRLLRDGIPGMRWVYKICYPSEIQATGTTGCNDTDEGYYTVFVRDNGRDLKSSATLLPTDSDQILVLRIDGTSTDGAVTVSLEAGVQVGAASFADPSYSGINENSSNSNTLFSNINYAAAGAVVHSGT